MEIIEEIKVQRQKEIEQGLNAATAYPLYLVYDETFTICESDTQYSQSTTVFNTPDKFIRFDDSGNEKKAEDNTEKWDDKKGKWSEVVKKSFHDRFITLCFTRKAAEDFIKTESHNLNKPKIYVEYAERRNTELRAILEILGDKL